MKSKSQDWYQVVGLLIAGLLLLAGILLPHAAEPSPIKITKESTAGPHLAPPPPAPGGLAHRQVVVCVATSPDGRWMVTGSTHPECRILLWDLTTGAPVHAFDGHANAITALAYSPDGRLLASASGLYGGHSNLIIWNMETREIAWQADTGVNALDAVAFAPDGRTLAGTGSNSAIEQWDAESGVAGPQLGVNFATGTGRDLCWCPDGRRIALVAGNYGYIVDRKTGRPVQELRQGSTARGIAVSPDGKLAAVIGGPTVRIWNLENGAAVGSFDTGRDNLDVTFSPDGTCVAIADRTNGAVVWDLNRRMQVHAFEIDGWSDGIARLAYTPDGRLLVAAAKFAPVLWNVGGLSADNEDQE